MSAGHHLPNEALFPCHYCSLELPGLVVVFKSRRLLKEHMLGEHQSLNELMFELCFACNRPRESVFLMATRRVTLRQSGGDENGDDNGDGNGDGNGNGNGSTVCAACRLFKNVFYCVLRGHRPLCICP